MRRAAYIQWMKEGKGKLPADADTQYSRRLPTGVNRSTGGICMMYYRSTSADVCQRRSVTSRASWLQLEAFHADAAAHTDQLKPLLQLR